MKDNISRMEVLRDKIIDIKKKYKNTSQQTAALIVIGKKIDKDNLITNSEKIVLKKLISRKKVEILREMIS